jgi:hypothetical protein
MSSFDRDPHSRFEEMIEQRHRREHLAETARRASSTQSEPLPPAWHGLVHVSVYPQDPFVDEPVMRTMPASDLRPGLSNDRFRVRDSSHPAAEPTGRGDYIFPPQQPEFDQINVLYYANLTLRMCEYYAQRPLPGCLA